MQFVRNWWERVHAEGWTLRNSAVAALLGVSALMVLYIGLTILGGLARTVTMGSGSYDMGMVGEPGYGRAYEEGGYGMMDDVRSFAMNTVNGVMGIGGGMSAKMMAPAMMESAIAPAPDYYGDGGDDAEKYERRIYNAHIETRDTERVCGEVATLKDFEYVLFDHTNEYEDGCSFTFRVTLEHESEVQAMVLALEPRSFNASVDTVAQTVAHHEDELAILERQLGSYKATLAEAEAAYAKVLSLATVKGDAGTLSSVITNKLATIERLTQQIQNVQVRIDRLAVRAADTLDETEYAHFSISVSKQVLVDWQSISDAWKNELRAFAREVNTTVLALTIGLLSFALQALVFLVFATLIILGAVFVGKYVWKAAVAIWRL